jgi:hypothetical protein
VQNSLKDGKVDFEPSAAAIHPLEKRLYILASAGNLLVITDLKGKVQERIPAKSYLVPAGGRHCFCSQRRYVHKPMKPNWANRPYCYIPYKPSGK